MYYRRHSVNKREQMQTFRQLKPHLLMFSGLSAKAFDGSFTRMIIARKSFNLESWC